MVLDFIESRREQITAQVPLPRDLACLLLTPRFRASSHVVHLVMAGGRPEPLLVAKVPRLENASHSIEREVRNLQQIQASRPGGFDSVPRLVAHESYRGRKLLVETALSGRPMDPSVVRAGPQRCCQLVLNWLAEINQSTSRPSSSLLGWSARVLEPAVRFFAGLRLQGSEEAHLLEQTRLLVEQLRAADIPLVFEHGDLSHPNILLLPGGGIGVVDWEQAEPDGLPAADLFFFLAYAAFSISRARTTEEYLAAFQAAFFGPSAWARMYVRTYASQTGLAKDTLTPLFLFTWLRYLYALHGRLSPAEQQESEQIAEWLRGNRFYALWQYAVRNKDSLVW